MDQKEFWTAVENFNLNFVFLGLSSSLLKLGLYRFEKYCLLFGNYGTRLGWEKLLSVSGTGTLSPLLMCAEQWEEP